MTKVFNEKLNDMVSCVNSKFEEIQAVLNSCAQEKFSLYIMGTDDHTNKTLKDVLEHDLTWSEDIAKTQGSFIKTLDLHATKQSYEELINSEEIKHCSAIILVQDTQELSSDALLALKELVSCYNSSVVLKHLVIVNTYVPKDNDSLSDTHNIHEAAYARVANSLASLDLISPAKQPMFYSLDLKKSSNELKPLLLELQACLLQCHQPPNLQRKAILEQVVKSEIYISNSLAHFKMDIIDKIIVHSKQYQKNNAQLNKLYAKADKLHNIISDSVNYDYDYISAELFQVYNLEANDELDRCYQQIDKHEQSIKALYHRLDRIFPNYPNLQKLPQDLIPLKPYFITWSKPLMRIIKLQRKTQKYFNDWFALHL